MRGRAENSHTRPSTDVKESFATTLRRGRNTEKDSSLGTRCTGPALHQWNSQHESTLRKERSVERDTLSVGGIEALLKTEEGTGTQKSPLALQASH